MAKQTSLQEQTSDPRWQRKRLEILERDEWTCKQCGDTETTLTVHHKSYRMVDGKFADYWDYEGDDLITLCTACHEEEERLLDSLKKQLFYLVRDDCENSKTIQMMVDILCTIKEENNLRITSDYLFDMFKSSDHWKSKGTGGDKC